MNEPLVSVIIPVKNRENTIGRAVQSVLDQTYRNLELLVVDDSSTDDTRGRVDEFDDERIRVIELAASLGASGARNRGIRESRGAWIAFQDSDDVWHREKLARQMQVVNEDPAETAAVYTSYRRINGNMVDVLPAPGGAGLDGDLHPRLCRGNVITTQTLLVRADLFEKVGDFDTDLSALNDWEFALRLSRHVPIRWVSEPLVDYHLQPDSLTRSLDLFVSNYERILELHGDDMAATPKQKAWHAAVIGNRLLRGGRAGQGRGYLRKAVEFQPASFQYRAAWLASWLPARSYNTLLKINARLRRQ